MTVPVVVRPVRAEDGAVVAEERADALDEHRVLDLIMAGTVHTGTPAATMQHEGDVA